VFSRNTWIALATSPFPRSRYPRAFVLDSLQPKVKFKDYAYGELRYRMLQSANPAEAEHLLGLAQKNIERRWQTYVEMATRGV